MAAMDRLLKALLFETIDDILEFDTLPLYICQNYLLYCLFIKKRRQFVPKICGYAEEVVPSYNPSDFKMHFRVSVETFEHICTILSNNLTSEHSGGRQQVSPSKMILVFLCYLSNQESMREVAHYFGLSKSTVHSIVLTVASQLYTVMKEVIRWPDNIRQEQISNYCQDKSGIPGIVGFLDGTHIRLTAPLKGDQDYINRKGFASVQLQLVVDHDLVITNMYCGWPGCTHDARVLRNSGLFLNHETFFDNNHFIIGDSAYPLQSWLITPYRQTGHLNPAQKLYNKKVSQLRQCVERAIGHLKGRFRRLREIPLHKAEDICLLISAGCILHNLCVATEDDFDNFIELEQVLQPNDFQNIQLYQNSTNGVERRETITRLFT